MATDSPLNTSPRRLWTVLGVLLLGLAATAVYKAWPVLFPPLQQKLSVDPDCNLRAGTCLTQLADHGSVRFGIEPRHIPMITPLQLEVVLSDPEVQSVQVDFSGVDMYMGFNRVSLQHQGQGRFIGEGRLPVCVYDSMEWEAQVLLHRGRDIISIPHRFITVKGAQR